MCGQTQPSRTEAKHMLLWNHNYKNLGNPEHRRLFPLSEQILHLISVKKGLGDVRVILAQGAVASHTPPSFRNEPIHGLQGSSPFGDCYLFKPFTPLPGTPG